MMDAKNLGRLPFFGKVGAFGVDLGDEHDGARAIRYAAKLLRAPRRLVWIFAQGREVPVTKRPLGFRPGSEAIARVARCAVVPGAIRYEMAGEPEPALWLSFGEASALGGHEARVTAELDAIDAAVLSGGAEGFDAIYTKRRGRGFALAEAALALVTRPKLLR